MRRSRGVQTGGLSRRKFLERMGLGCAVGGVGGLGVPSLAWGQEASGPIDCGPPPKAKKQHRTGGEAFAPLPLPVKTIKSRPTPSRSAIDRRARVRAARARRPGPWRLEALAASSHAISALRAWGRRGDDAQWSR